jgi:exosortase/archaeosortase family protein
MEKKVLTYTFFRYFVLMFLGVPSLFIFYFIFTPLTFYPVFWVLEVIYSAIISTGDITIACSAIASNSILPSFLSKYACFDTTILFKGYFASIIPACIAGSAYYLLTILNLSTPMSNKTRFKSFFFLLSTFLILNILRILVFAILFVKKGYAYFDIAHAATWYFGSTILVVFIWFANVLIFKIKAVPIYTDFKNLSQEVFKKEKSQKVKINTQTKTNKPTNKKEYIKWEG